MQNRIKVSRGFARKWLDLSAAAMPPDVTATAEDNQMNSHPLTVEFVGKVSGLGRLTQIVVKLPSSLRVGQEVRVNVTLRGKTSNKVRVRIK
jgi:uncharacterized protein (TIGR03437 family)